VSSVKDVNIQHVMNPGMDFVRERNTEDTIYFNFSYSALKLLGKILYNNAANAISELVATSEFPIKIKPLSFIMMLDNIIGNAIKARATHLSIIIDTTDPKKYSIVFVDNGVGIDASVSNTEKLFDFGVTTTNGSGLGLYYGKKLMGYRYFLYPYQRRCVVFVHDDQHMEILYGEDAGYHGGCYFEYDAVIDGVCHVSMLEGNLCKLIRVKDSLKTDSKSVYDIVCYPEQLDMIQEYLIEFHGKNRISLRTVTIEQVHDCLFEE